MGTCPICLEEYPMEVLQEHAEICASRKFDGTIINNSNNSNKYKKKNRKRIDLKRNRNTITIKARENGPGDKYFFLLYFIKIVQDH